MIKQLLEKYPNSVKDFATHLGIPIPILDIVMFDRYVKYFDELGLFIGITCDADGIFWIAEVCETPLGVVHSRKDAENLAISECFKMQEEMMEFAVK